MTIHYQDESVTVHAGDCLDVLRGMPDASVDAVVTDPPYGLEFMGREWDSFKPAAVLATEGSGGRKKCRCESPDFPNYLLPKMHAFQSWCEQWATECLRVLKPGGHLLAFGGTRTWHRLACAIEDAGFEMRDSIAWLYGSGFPKSLDVSKAIDKADGRQGAVTPNTGRLRGGQSMGAGPATWMSEGEYVKTTHTPATDDARTWQGWGTALKPAHEPIVVARKPLSGTVAANVLAHGTGALNIDATRIDMGDEYDPTKMQRQGAANDIYVGGAKPGDVIATYKPAGRWPANVVLSPEAAAELDRQSGVLTSHDTTPGGDNAATHAGTGYNEGWAYTKRPPGRGDSGGASRFFPTFRYEAKAPTVERPRVDGMAHPTTKPLDLMRWLVRLVTPPGGLVLDPFAGSGTTAEACVLEHLRCVTIEREPDYLPLIVARLSKPMQVGFDFDGGAA